MIYFFHDVYNREILIPWYVVYHRMFWYWIILLTQYEVQQRTNHRIQRLTMNGSGWLLLINTRF